jgi:hypothetical protein
MNEQIKQILNSLLITLSVSVVFAFGVMLFTKNNTILTFLGITISAFFFQFFASYLWNHYLLLKKETADDEIYKKYIEVGAKQEIDLSCAYCSAKNTVNIDLNRENYFLCKQCNQNNVVLLEFSTAQAGLDVTNDDDRLETNIMNKIQKLSSDNTSSINVKDHTKPIAEFKK